MNWQIFNLLYLLFFFSQLGSLILSLKSSYQLLNILGIFQITYSSSCYTKAFNQNRNSCSLLSKQLLLFFPSNFNNTTKCTVDTIIIYNFIFNSTSHNFYIYVHDCVIHDSLPYIHKLYFNLRGVHLPKYLL